MDKFITRHGIQNTDISLEKYRDLFDLIKYRSENQSDSKQSMEDQWNNLIKEWRLTKYPDDITPLAECSCGSSIKICITNLTEKVMICPKCVYLFPDINTIYTNLDKVVNNILNELIFHQIHYELMTFLNLDHGTVDKYNKNGCKNRRNIKIYTILSKLGQYHSLHHEYQEKLNNIYTKISRNIDTHEVLEKIDKCLANIKTCNKCQPLNQCIDCFKENNGHLVGITDEQLVALWKVYRHILNDNKLKYGLYGSAGTGKTTLIKYILQIHKLNELFILKELRDIFGLDYKKDKNEMEDLIEKKLDEYDKNQNTKVINGTIVEALYSEKTIVLASPTNKALDVIKEKVNSLPNFIIIDNFTGQINEMKVIFFTISKLLTYRRHLDSNHQMYFKRARKYINIMDKYNLVIIDESSMINKENIDDINSDINNHDSVFKGFCKGFILFTGDRAQLPPPKERYSAVFKLDMFKVELQTVMRTDKDKIISLSKFIREWLTKHRNNVRKELLSFRCEYIKFYTNQEKFIDDFCQTTDAIILVWTNDTKNKYNSAIRDKLFGEISKKKYMVNEHLIFNNFYKLQTKNNDERVFYSSMPIIVRDIEINPMYVCEKLNIDEIVAKVDEKMRLDQNMVSLHNEDLYENAKNYLQKFVNMFNRSMVNTFKVWVLYFNYKGYAEEYPVYVVYNQKLYIKAINQGKNYIKEYFDRDNKMVFDEAKESIREIIVNVFDEYYEQPFADLAYGYAMTCDKSQGSTFSQVFIDSPDMLDQTKYPFLDITVAKKRYYTAITRASDKVNILI